MTNVPPVEIYFHLKGKRHAYRAWHHVPRVGDKVVLDTGMYKVADVAWFDGSDENIRPVAVIVSIVVSK